MPWESRKPGFEIAGWNGTGGEISDVGIDAGIDEMTINKCS